METIQHNIKKIVMTEPHKLKNSETFAVSVVIVGVENETTVCYNNYTYGNDTFRILITKEKNYYNVYVIDEYFKKEPLNCLKLQEPKEVLKEKTEDEFFNKMYLEFQALQHYLWMRYSNNEEVLSFGIEVYKD